MDEVMFFYLIKVMEISHCFVSPPDGREKKTTNSTILNA